MSDTRKRGKAAGSAAGMPDRLYVVAQPEGWVIKSDCMKRTGPVYSTQAEATAAAEESLRTSGGGLFTQDRNGRWRESFILGRDAMGKVNAVEGISLTGEMKQDLREFDRHGLSAAERRHAIAKKYGRKRS